MLTTTLALTDRRQGEPLPRKDQIGVGTDALAIEGVHLIGVVVHPLWGRLRAKPLLTVCRTKKTSTRGEKASIRQPHAVPLFTCLATTIGSRGHPARPGTRRDSHRRA